MTSNSHLRWIRLCGVVALGVIVFASVLLPKQWEQLRTGHWLLEHFLAYFAAAFVVTLGWGRPWAVAAVFIAAAALLETLQSLTPNHTPDLLSALSGVGGALVAVLLAKFVMGARLFRPGNGEPETSREDEPTSLLYARPENQVGSAMTALKAAMARNWLAWILAALLVIVLYGRFTLGQNLTKLGQNLTKLCHLTGEALEWPTGEAMPSTSGASDDGTTSRSSAGVPPWAEKIVGTSETSDDGTSRSSAGVLAPWAERLIGQVAKEHTQPASEGSLRGQLWRWQHANREQIEKICGGTVVRDAPQSAP
jgi:VanZ family protein